MKKRYQSKILQAIHEDMEGLHKLGIVTDAEMREFDEDCLVKESKTANKTAIPARIKRAAPISAKRASL